MNYTHPPCPICKGPVERKIILTSTPYGKVPHLEKPYRWKSRKTCSIKCQSRLIALRGELYVPSGTIKCTECDLYPADLPSRFCPGCEAYREHTR